MNKQKKNEVLIVLREVIEYTKSILGFIPLIEKEITKRISWAIEVIESEEEE